MTTLPLGVFAYARQSASEPEIKLINRFLETNPTNLVNQVALLARPATQVFSYASGTVPTDAPRGLYSKTGLFKDDLFAVVGSNLWRINATTGSAFQIGGSLSGAGRPYATWDKGIGYERIFFSDGVKLQYYAGGTHATGTLTRSGTITNQVIEIGGQYYSWNSLVNTNSPDGSAAHPWLCNPGTDPLLNMSILLVYGGTPGVDFSSALPGPNNQVAATVTGGPPATALVITAITDTALGNAITTSVYSGSSVAWGASTLTGGGTETLAQIVVPTGEGIGALATINHFVMCAVSGSQKMFYLRPGSVVMDGLDFAEKENNPDPVVDLVTVGDVVMVLGEGSMETWYATGDNNNPVGPIAGRAVARGVIAGTAVNVKDQVLMVGNDGVVYGAGNPAYGGLQRVSTHGIEERIRRQIRAEKGFP